MNVVLALRQADARLVLELALSAEPGVTVVGTASETEGMLALAHTARPDLLLLEWDLPGRPVPDVLAAAVALTHPIRVLIVSHDPTLRQVALTAGAYAFVLIGDLPELLLGAVCQARPSAHDLILAVTVPCPVVLCTSHTEGW